ncbi:hypothetical protein [Eilatimonas milleporae]|uniref:ABC-type amino acid transport substrate-binding protein n=1 Tax=Eilatimonas milleporae TaxID=911205 RepID=A0A3M0CU12_9PROT|nr:hypothetical protein [Eilatimonas milleporae]RMB12475.1 hypothetical protein BXY39_0971 [Eilatimonas milleporae]
MCRRHRAFYKLIVFCAVFSAVKAGKSHALEPTGPIYGTAWGLTLSIDGSGFYNDYMRALLTAADTTVTYIPLPSRRARKAFAGNPGSCIFPSARAILSAPGTRDVGGLIETGPLIHVRGYIFSQADAPVLARLSDLEGRSVAFPSGAMLPRLLKGIDATLLPVPDEMDKARLLIHRRVDYISGTLPDISFVFHELGHSMPPYGKRSRLGEQPLALVCHDRPGNRRLVDRISEILPIAARTARLAARLKAVGLNPSEYLPSAAFND